MTLATLTGVAPSLAELVDGLAGRTGAWVVVERLGSVIAHGTGTAGCPPPVAEAVVTKKSQPLRAAVTWSRTARRPTAALEGLPVSAVELGDGITAWFVGGAPEESAVPLLAEAARGEERPVTDPVVAELLRPRGPHRRGHAPRALLVALTHKGSAAELSRRAAAVVTGTTARVHCEDGLVLVALPPEGDAELLHRQLATPCPTVVAGVAEVVAEADDWTAAARLAAESARVAARLGMPVASTRDPEVAAELLVTEAQSAVADLLRALPEAPLRKLQEHDARSSGELVRSLTAWCRAAFDVTAAAGALHVHPNTLRYRLKRATEVCGMDLSRPRQMLALQLLLEV